MLWDQLTRAGHMHAQSILADMMRFLVEELDTQVALTLCRVPGTQYTT